MKADDKARILSLLRADPGRSYSLDELAKQLEMPGKDDLYTVLEGLVEERLVDQDGEKRCFRIKAAPSHYDTRQKREVLSFFEGHSSYVYTADEVAAALPGTGRSTVYRIISELAESGVLLKSIRRGRKQCWQYARTEDCSAHMHIECESCGRIEHLDKESTEKLRRLIERTTGYAALNDSVFHGLCPECRRKKT